MDARRRGLSDPEQLAFATSSERILITFNRSDFHALHRANATHAGIITCTRDPDIAALTGRIHAALSDRDTTPGILLQVIRGHRPPLG